MYPLKFEDILRPIIWGGEEISRFKQLPEIHPGVGESWEISQVGDRVSVVSEGADKGKNLTELIKRDGAALLGKHVAERYGEKFPLLIKFIDAHDNLSIQVHPNDEVAMARHNSFGKTEMWYVIDAKPGAGLYSGFSQQITPEEYVERIKNNTITDVLQFHQVKSGDVFFLPAGRIHAICKGILIAEIQQSSDITYRIYDYDRRDAQGNPRELHVEQSIAAVDFKMYDNLRTQYEARNNDAVTLVECPFFETNLIEVDKSVKRPVAAHDSFVIYMCMGGKVRLTDNNGYTITLHQGQTSLVPASLKSVTIEAESPAKLLECYIPVQK